MSSQTFVFSLGAWVVPAVFDATRSHLEDLGFPSACPAHPSIGAEPPSMTLRDDVISLRGVLETYADEGRDIILVAHSYGGVVASCAVEGLTKPARTQAGKPGGVTKVIYLAAFALNEGESLLGILGGEYLPWMKVQVGNRFLGKLFLHLENHSTLEKENWAVFFFNPRWDWGVSMYTKEPSKILISI